jgi:hypothetical protein
MGLFRIDGIVKGMKHFPADKEKKRDDGYAVTVMDIDGFHRLYVDQVVFNSIALDQEVLFEGIVYTNMKGLPGLKSARLLPRKITAKNAPVSSSASV